MSGEFTPAIIIHTSAALTAAALGGAVFFGRKGTPRHRVAGRIWVALMMIVAGSTWWIRRDGHFSWIHGLSVLTLLLLGVAVYFAATGNIRRHRNLMIGVYAGALVTAGAFTLLPQRLLGGLLWTALGVV